MCAVTSPEISLLGAYEKYHWMPRMLNCFRKMTVGFLQPTSTELHAEGKMSGEV